MYQLFFLCIIIGTVIVYIYREKLQKFFGHHTAQVATLTIEHESVKDKVGLLSKEISQNLLDYYTKDEGKVAATYFIKSIIEDQKTQDSLVNLVNEVLVSPKFNEQAVQVASNISHQVINDTAVLNDVQNLFTKVLQNQDTSNQLVVSFSNLFNDPKIIAELEVLGTKVISSDQFNREATDLAQTTSEQILSNPELTQKMAEFLSLSIDDPKLQEEVGKALWQSIKLALLPQSLIILPPTTTFENPLQHLTNPSPTII
jgi:hypothetical protein